VRLGGAGGGILLDAEGPDGGGAVDAGAGAEVHWDDELPGVRRFYTEDPWGNRLQIVDYRDIQFTKAPSVLAGMGLDGLEKRGFVFNNPNVVKSCGCGSSFQV